MRSTLTRELCQYNAGTVPVAKGTLDTAAAEHSPLQASSVTGAGGSTQGACCRDRKGALSAEDCRPAAQVRGQGRAPILPDPATAPQPQLFTQASPEDSHTLRSC